jgi:16S rRNA C967 or C1407 C5-methylase (RsmB/RsmF family)
VNSLADYQKQFVKAACKITKPGGTIVYSVCTYTTQECEQVVQFAERECGLRIVEQELFLASKGLGAPALSSNLCQRFHPHINDIGYFIAKFKL